MYMKLDIELSEAEIHLIRWSLTDTLSELDEVFADKEAMKELSGSGLMEKAKDRARHLIRLSLRLRDLASIPTP
jgi:hypothetical protein